MQVKNIIVEKSIGFAIEIIKFCELLEAQRKFVISNQLMRCGTSIGANVFEAQHAESRADFIHKMKLAVKEANETSYWLTLCKNSNGCPNDDNLQHSSQELIKIISKIIVSSKTNK